MPFTSSALAPPKISVDVTSGRMQGTRVLWLPNVHELDTAIEELAGLSYDAGGSLVSAIPTAWPGKPWLILQNIEADGHGDAEAFGGVDDGGDSVEAVDGDGLEQPKNGYKLTLTYATPQFDAGEMIDLPQEDLPEVPVETYLTVNRDISASMLALDVEGLRWRFANSEGSSTIPESTSVGQVIPQINYILKWNRVVNPPFTAIKELVGTINEEEFLGHASGTVMFVGVRDQRSFQTDGSRQWELEYVFEVKEVKYNATLTTGEVIQATAGWDYFFRPDPSPQGEGIVTSRHPWQRIVGKNGEDIFQYTDFARLFQPEPDAP